MKLNLYIIKRINKIEANNLNFINSIFMADNCFTTFVFTHIGS